jgi:tetratricopeptide (TPR) repeat protein
MSKRIRIAIAQIHSVPAYASRVHNYREEPAPALPEPDRFPGFLGDLAGKRGVPGLARVVGAAHQQDLDSKLRSILLHCGSLRPHVVFFPEYSIGQLEIPLLAEAARAHGFVVVAGSHVVRTTRSALDAYRKSPLKDIATQPAEFAGKAVSPILFPDGSAQVRFKTVRSKWEPDLVLHAGPQAPVSVLVPGSTVQIDLRICIEAPAVLQPGYDLIGVVASSPTTKPFDDLFALSLWSEVAGVLCNDASFGRSAVRVVRQLVAPDFKELLELPAHDEALLVVDIDLDEQRLKRESIVEPTPFAIVARAPLLYEAIPEHAEVGDWIAAVREGKRALAPEEVKRYASRRRLPESLRQQLKLLSQILSNRGDPTADEGFLVDAVRIGRQTPPFSSRCVQALEHAQHAVAALLVGGDNDPALSKAISRMGAALQQWKGKQPVLAEALPPLSDAAVDRESPLQDRQEERATLVEFLRREHLVVLEGLPGIGKKRLAAAVVAEVAPKALVLEKHCAAGVPADQLVEELVEEIGIDLDSLSTMSPATRARVSRIIILHNADAVLEEDGGGAFTEFVRRLAGTGVRVLALSARQLRGIPGARRYLGRLPEEDLERILRFWCETYGVQAPPGLARKLHGYPLAARFAAVALREGRQAGVDHVRFVRELRSEIVRVLLADIQLPDDEERALRALCIFRRPVHHAVLEMLPIDDLADMVERLEERLLIERMGDQIFVTPLIRDFAEEEWLRAGGYGAFHSAAADFYRGQAAVGSLVGRLEAREEAIYHLAAAGRFKEARELGVSWEAEARAAMRDLARRRQYQECLVVCEQLVSSKGYSAEVGGYVALSYAKLKKYPDARAEIEKLRRFGAVAGRTLTAVGEALVIGGAFTEGMPLLEEAAQTNPEDAYVRAAIADALLDRNQPERAEEFIEEALRLDARNFRALEVASRIARSRNRPEDALKLAKRARRIQPTRAQRVIEKAMAALRRKYGENIPPAVLADDEEWA